MLNNAFIHPFLRGTSRGVKKNKFYPLMSNNTNTWYCEYLELSGRVTITAQESKVEYFSRG